MTAAGRRRSTSAASTAEWIPPEMVRRLAHHVVDGYRTDRTITDVVDTTELWFVPVANPDGYDFTFTPATGCGWNLRDNDGDGRITANDGVDLNRNFPTKWGYDDEGRRLGFGSDTYGDPVPLGARDAGARPADGASASSSSSTTTPPQRTCCTAPLAGGHTDARRRLVRDSWATPRRPRCPATTRVCRPTSTPPTASPTSTPTSRTARRVHHRDEHLPDRRRGRPDDEWDPAGCANILEFPDDEALVEAEFRKNLPFALSIAQSAANPAEPVTPSERQAPEFVVDSFDVSYGDPQTVAVVARRDQHNQRLEYQVNGGRTRRGHVREWKGGERYGDERDRYYAELRGGDGTRPGDSVEVWFTARRDGRRIESEHFTYTVASDTGADALILASEDYTGVNPTYPAGTAGRSTPTSTPPPSTPTASATPRGTSTPRVSRIRSACSATSTPWCGRRATTGWCRTPRTRSPTRSCSAPSPTSPSPSASST